MQINKKSPLVFLFFTCLIVFGFYFHTLNYPWKHYDEKIVFDEALLPIPCSFLEIFELIREFGVINFFEAANPFYSNISNLRGTPVDVLFFLFIFFIFKKSTFAYHLFSLILHLANTVLCFYLLSQVVSTYNNKTSSSIKYTIISLLTLLWSLHPTNIESILLVTNIGSLVTYFMCLLIFWIFITHKNKNTVGFNLQDSIILFIIYLFPLLLNEYSVTLPVALFFYFFATDTFKNKKPLGQSLIKALKDILPLMFSLIIFFIYYFIFSPKRILAESNLLVNFERIFWLAPQILIHFFKLAVLPINLSVDQSAHVQLSNSIFGIYSMICFLITLILFSATAISIFNARKKTCFYFLIFLPSLITLIPFLHILSPIYTLASERYLYLPLFFFIFGLSHIIFEHLKSSNKTILITVIIFFIVLTYSIRTLNRIFEWQNNDTFLSSAIKTAPNNLYKGLRLFTLLNSLQISNQSISYLEAKKYITQAKSYLEKEIKNLKTQKAKQNDKTPKIIKFYGLDKNTLLAKSYFLLALLNYSLDGDSEKALKTFSPYAKNLKVLDTTILDFYYRILFLTKNSEKAELILLDSLNKKRISPILYIALSDLYEYKSNDLKLTEYYLKESFKYFPYDPLTLFGLKRLYKKLNNLELFAYYSYLYGLRMHDPSSLKESTVVYITLNNKERAEKLLKKLLAYYKIDSQIINIKTMFKDRFGPI
ncbi:MAG: hypothetical protein HYY52_01550 [Candidatus Melainabacteria bacterium]|nr:hypothetical protein [Candidatus Melainabacteria bacterium]